MLIWMSLQACLAFWLPVCMRGTPASSRRSCCEITMTLYNHKHQLQMPLQIDVPIQQPAGYCTTTKGVR